MPYFTAASIEMAVVRLHGTAHHLLKIWWTMKQMGMDIGLGEFPHVETLARKR
jgi:hypothetical protein